MPTPVPITSVAAFHKSLDRCGELITRKLASDAEPWREELKGLLALIREHYKNSPPELPIRAEGALYYIDLTKRENEREISSKPKAFEALKKVMGLSVLIQALTIPFKLLDKHICADKQANFVTLERTGSRDVSAVLKSAPKAA